ncbi:hypothetical protein CK203_068945 [Vitis vinifera]|uniref:Endonuclease/exonuclease/phosphatase domain-containing protein n=1 Tax=Vitis vinifera TaxID=29760 RepID=A0A438F0U7_VITVI|nr:hypothetical protein CK203_068945 [Vitis vinifera]
MSKQSVPDVYDPNCRREKENFWDELGAIRGLWSGCVGGDFNMIRFRGEHSRGGGLTSIMRRFSEVLEELELRDIPLQGGPFTLGGGMNNQSHFRLDQFLVTDNWDSLFNGIVQLVLPRPISDHFPFCSMGEASRGDPLLLDLKTCG